MAEKSNDLIMKLVGDDGKTITGETITKLKLRKSEMSNGFAEGFMFELLSFSLKTGLSGDVVDELMHKKQGEDEKTHDQVNNALQTIGHAAGVNIADIRKPRGGSFAAFRKTKNPNSTFPVDMSPIQFSRSVDLTSPLLLDYCIKRRVFESASLIKRRAAGGPASGEIFLRIDFKTVLLKSVDWDDDDPIKEDCEFVCRAIAIRYLPQLPDGTLGAPIQIAWSSAPKVTAEDIDR